MVPKQKNFKSIVKLTMMGVKDYTEDLRYT